jgi:hypothetical protein
VSRAVLELLSDVDAAYRAEVEYVKRLQDALRFILRACDDPNMERDPRLDAISEVARKALRA